MRINSAIIHYGIAIAGLKGVSLLMLPIITGFLSPDSYGMLNFLVSISAMLSIFLGFGMAEVMFRFSASFAKTELEAFIAKCIKFTFVISAVFILIAISAAELWLSLLPLPIAKLHFILLMLNLAFSTIQASYLSRYRVLQQSKSYMYIALAQGGGQALLSYVLLNLQFGIEGLLFSGAITSFVVTLIVAVRLRHLLSKPTARLTKVHLQYGGYIALSALCLYGLSGAENWFIATTLGAEQLAYYFIAAQFTLAVSLAFEPFRLWWFPIRFNRYFASSELAANGAVVGCMVITLLALVMMIFAPMVIAWLLAASYQSSSQYIAPLCIILVIKTYAELLNLGCYLDKTARLVPIINGGCAAITVLAIAVLIRFYAIDGVIAGLMLGHVIRFFAFFLISQRLAPLNYQLGAVATVFCVLPVQWLFAEQSGWLNLCLLIVAAFQCTLFAQKLVLPSLKHKVGRAM